MDIGYNVVNRFYVSLGAFPSFCRLTSYRQQLAKCCDEASLRYSLLFFFLSYTRQAQAGISRYKMPSVILFLAHVLCTLCR